MHLILEYDIEALKQLILKKANINILEPGLFKILASKISIATKKAVSETTLKRIFGKVANTSQPSQYTLNVLSEYCGYESWNEFCQQNKPKPQQVNKDQQVKEVSLFSKARELSQYTLQALKNKSGIPFNLTIPREFLEEYLDIFLSTDHTATVLTAPAGYGKTIAMCHWVEAQLNNNKKTGGNDLILFLNARVFNKHIFKENINQWLLSLIGLTTDQQAVLTDYVVDHKYYLIIDAFDTTTLDQEQLDLLFNLLDDAISAYASNPNFRVILTMRESDWMIMYRKLEITNKLNNWFFGLNTEDSSKANFKPLNADELQQLICKINPDCKPIYDQQLLSLFCYPLFFQYYYQAHPKDLCLDKLNMFKTYQVIYTYILEKVYTGRYSTEKVLLINSLLESGEFTRGKFIIDKLKVYSKIKEYSPAYQEMISIGIIREMNFSGYYGYKESIEFVNNRIGAYFIAAKLIYENNGEFNKQLIQKINSKVNQDHRLYIIKWTVYIAIKNKEYTILDDLPTAELIAREKAALVKFLTKLIKDGLLDVTDTEDEPLTFDTLYPNLFKYMLGVELISEDYNDTLEALLTLKVKDQSRIFIIVTMAVANILLLNAQQVERCINELKTYSKESLSIFPINPLCCIEAIYKYLMYQTIHREAFEEITRFMFNPYSKRRQIENISSHYTLYLLALGTLALSQNTKKVLRLIRILHHLHNINHIFIPEFNFFLIACKAYFNLLDSNIDEAVILQSYLITDYKDNEKKYTPLMKVCLDFLSTSLLKYLPYQQLELSGVGVLTNKDQREQFKLVLINILSYYLTTGKIASGTEAYRNLFFKFILLIRSTSFKAASFAHNYDKLRLQAVQAKLY